jgi:type II secretory pathway component PulF
MKLAYAYSAKDSRGAIVEGMVFCGCYDDAVYLVKNALRLHPILTLKLKVWASMLRLLYRPQPIRDMIRLYRTIAERKRVGRPIPSGIGDAMHYVHDKELRSALAVMRQAMLDGEGFSKAMQRANFPATDVYAVEAVEPAGKEADTLLTLAEHLEMREALKDRTVSIVWYPCFLLAAMWLAAWAITLFIAPKLGEFFSHLASLNVDLPAYAKAYYGFAATCRDYWPLSTALWFAMPVAATFLVRTRLSTWLIDRVPALHELSMKADLVTTFSALALLMSAGVKPVEAFSAVARAARRPDNRERFQEMAGIYRSGNFSIARAVQLCAFPSYVIAEVSAGESAQNPTEGMRRLVAIMRQDLSIHMDQAQRLIMVAANVVTALFLLGFVFITIIPQMSATLSRL